MKLLTKELQNQIRIATHFHASIFEIIRLLQSDETTQIESEKLRIYMDFLMSKIDDYGDVLFRLSKMRVHLAIAYGGLLRK